MISPKSCCNCSYFEGYKQRYIKCIPTSASCNCSYFEGYKQRNELAELKKSVVTALILKGINNFYGIVIPE